MEVCPSKIINNEVQDTIIVDPTTPQASEFESPCFTVLGGVIEVETEPSSSLSLTRGGREAKPPIKYQDME